MKTAITLLAAALSVAALSTNASAQQRMSSNLGTTFPSVVTEKGSNILQQAGASMNTGSRSSISVAPIPSPSPRVRVPAPDKHNATQTQAPFQTTAFPTEERMPSVNPAVNTIVGGGKGNGIAPGGKGNGIVAGGKGSSSAVLVKTYCSGYCVYDDQGADTSFGTRSGGGFKLASNKAELGTGAIGVIHPSYMPNPDKLWGLDEDSLTEGSAGEIDILSNTSIVLGDEAIGIIHPDYVPIDPEVPGEAIGVIHPDYVPIDPEEVPGEAMAYRLIASLIEGDPDRPDPTSVVAPTGETQGSNVATATEYDLIAALIAGTADPGGEGTYTTTTGEADAAKTFDYCVIYPERCTVSEIERPTFGPHMVTFDNLIGSADPRR